MDPFPPPAPKKGPKPAPVFQFAEKPSDLVYDKSRYIQNYGPNVIYIPSKAIMFKLMRSCIKCEDSLDLWVNSTTSHLLGNLCELIQSTASQQKKEEGKDEWD